MHGHGDTVRAAAPLGLGAEAAAGLREAWRAAWTSRAVVVAAALAGLALLGQAPGWGDYDPARLTQPFGGVANVLVAPFARWDSVWFVAIARDGYASEPTRTAFFPLYPAAAALAGAPFGSALLGGLAVSWAAFLAGLAAVHRLAARDLGERYAAPAVMAVAWFPSSLFLSAVYSESLFLALSAGAFLAARRGAWAWAGALGALCAATRSTGVLLVVPIALLALYGPRDDRSGGRRRENAAWWRPRYAPGRELAWAGLVPLGLGAYLGYLALCGLDPLEPFRAQQAWLREVSVPLAGVWEGLHSGWDGVLRLAGGGELIWRAGGGDPLQDAALNVALAAFLLVALAGAAGVFRRLPAAYGAWTALSLAVPLSAPVAVQPLMSLPRFMAVCFPLQIVFAAWAVDRGVTRRALVGSGVGLACLSAVWGTWTFLA